MFYTKVVWLEEGQITLIIIKKKQLF